MLDPTFSHLLQNKKSKNVLNNISLINRKQPKLFFGYHTKYYYVYLNSIIFIIPQKCACFDRTVSSDGSESFVYGKNTVVMSSGQSTDSAILDRSPCGSGTAAIMANLFGKGKLKIGIFLLFFSYRNYD